ncbi:MAG: glycosyltransferase [Ruminococcus sp.]|nr:glycosyltransferase [Ruminococcus sp.]
MAKKEYKVGKYTLSPYSVLMVLCKKELPENLNVCLESMLMQSYPPSDLVLVCREGLTNELRIIVKSFQNEFKDIFRIVTASDDMSVGQALNKGMKECKCEYIVRMDSDDISKEDRCLKQMTLFAIKPNLAISGTFVEEFDSDSGETIALKKVPVLHRDIMRYARRRNPFNRQAVAFKKSAALAVGGYSDAEQFEDYDLIVKMLMDDCYGQNIPEALVRYRVDEDTFRQRKSRARTKAFIKVRKNFRRCGFCKLTDVLVPCSVQCLLMIMPRRFTKWFYKKYLREKKK